jgi:hypothetical protein
MRRGNVRGSKEPPPDLTTVTAFDCVRPGRPGLCNRAGRRRRRGRRPVTTAVSPKRKAPSAGASLLASYPQHIHNLKNQNLGG